MCPTRRSSSSTWTTSRSSNASDGVHIASAAGVWSSLVFGFGGVRDFGGRLSFAPRLPRAWNELAFALRFCGRQLRVKLTHDEERYLLEEGEPLNVLIRGESQLNAASSQAARHSSATPPDTSGPGALPLQMPAGEHLRLRCRIAVVVGRRQIGQRPCRVGSAAPFHMVPAPPPVPVGDVACRQPQAAISDLHPSRYGSGAIRARRCPGPRRAAGTGGCRGWPGPPSQGRSGRSATRSRAATTSPSPRRPS